MMDFNKNQVNFKSEKHQNIWQYGVLVLPSEITLNEDIKAMMNEDLFESCKQMRFFIIQSLSFMYENADSYQIEPQKYFRFWYDLLTIVNHSGEVNGERLIINFSKWKKVKWQKYYVDRMDDWYENIFAKTGIKIKVSEETLEITNSLYPKMFCAMEKLLNKSRYLKEKVSADNSFFYCDFRKICPEYKSDKTKDINDIEDKISTVLDGKVKADALKFITYLKNNKMSPKYAKINNAWKFDYKGKCL
jgi:hypothetical protein